KADLEQFEEEGKTPILASVDGKLSALFGILDPPRPGAAALIKALRHQEVRPVLVTGDREATARTVARQIGIEEVSAEALLDLKQERVRRYAAREPVAWVTSQPLNARALVSAHVGI